MKLGIINSCFDQVGMDAVTGLEHIARIGFDCVDIFTEAMTLSASKQQTIADTCARLKLPIISLPVVAVGLIDPSPAVRAFHIERCKRFIDLAVSFGARNILLVLGEYIWQREVIPAHEQWQWALESCRAVGDYAETKSIDIALELEPFRLSLLNNVTEMLRFLTDCDHPRVLANIDVSHWVLSDCGPDTIAALKGRAAHVHISDCDGKVHGDLPPGRGIVKFSPYLQAIKELDLDSPISIELEFAPNPDRIVQWVEEAYTKTAALMRLNGMRG